MPLFTSSTCNQVANSLRVSPLLLEWTDQLVFAGIDNNLIPAGNGTAIGNSRLVEAYNLIPEIPFFGDKHPVYADCVCIGVEVQPTLGSSGPSPDSLTVNVQWIQVRNNNGKVACTGNLSEYQMQEIANFDINGDKTKVVYKVDHAGSKDIFPDFKIADIRIPRSMFALEITQYEVVSGKNFAMLSNLKEDQAKAFRMPFYNILEYQGYPANTLLYLGNRLEYNSTPIARRTYFYLSNDRGWNKFLAVYTQQNGYVPKDLSERPDDVLNPSKSASDIMGATPPPSGFGVFDMLDSADFNTYFPNMGSWIFP